MSEQGFTCQSPSLALPNELSLLRPVHGKIIFHETSPWCQKGWGPLSQSNVNKNKNKQMEAN